MLTVNGFAVMSRLVTLTCSLYHIFTCMSNNLFFDSTSVFFFLFHSGLFRTVTFSVFQTSFGLIRITMVVIPFLYVGTLISKNFAALLEEHDIFVPEDDDDDD